MFILDTDQLGILQQESASQYVNSIRRISQFPETSFFVTVVSFHEQITGWNAYLARSTSASALFEVVGIPDTHGSAASPRRSR